jgi:Na+-transporting NADH:ubiquinone oxidoreductase subunit NqrC
MNIIILFVTISLVAAVVVGGNMIIIPPINAQENLTSSQSQNATTATTNATSAAEERTYILIFGQRTVGNIDNSTKIVSSVVGNNSAKIQEEFLEEISLAPSQQLEEQINMIVNDGINGSPCGGVSLTTEQGENVSVDCISSENTVIWYIYPTS